MRAMGTSTTRLHAIHCKQRCKAKVEGLEECCADSYDIFFNWDRILQGTKAWVGLTSGGRGTMPPRNF